MSKAFVCYDETCDRRVKKPMKPLNKWPAKWLVVALLGSGCLGGVVTFGWRWLRTPYVLEDTQAQVAESKTKIQATQSNIADIVIVLRDHGAALTNIEANAQRTEQWQLSLTKSVNELNTSVAHMQGTLEGIQGKK